MNDDAYREDDIYLDKWAYLEEQYNPEPEPRRKRKAGAKPAPNPQQARQVADLAEPSGLEGGFDPTYQPARYEAEWLLSSLRGFYDEELITDVMAQVKGGKEASVYRCAASPTTGEQWLAAKVYRPRMFRNLRNDKMYRDGRDILTADGRAAKKTDHRLMRAVGKKTSFGVQVSHTSWLMHEFSTLELLRNAGAAVPKPFAAGENALLMSYIGDEVMAAPILNSVTLETGEAKRLFAEALRNIELMLQHGFIHGDLSAYNILYWEGALTIIDFPQVTNSQTNKKARFILQRDIERVCEYFARQGIDSDPDAITENLWNQYVGVRAIDQALEDELIGLPPDDDDE